MKNKISLTTKDTNKYGRGIFADNDIAKNSVIYVLKGVVVPVSKVVENVNTNTKNIDNHLQIGRRTYLDLDAFSALFNHSCNPNAGLRKKSELFALKDIEKGEQITYDYSLTTAPTVWKMYCKCGEKNCRKTIHDIKSIPKKQLQKYLREGNIQDYMMPVLREIRKGTFVIKKYDKDIIRLLKKTDNCKEE